MKVRILLAALLFGIHPCGYAQEAAATPAHSYQPANFPADQSRFIRRIKFPSAEQDVFVRVFCESQLTKYGRLQGSLCTSEHPDADDYIVAVTARLDRTGRLEPARVDDVRVPVWFQYTVQFERVSGVETIKLFPHHFVGVAGSGEGYVGPQRYRASRKPPCRTYYDFWFIATIPAEGGPPAEIGIENPGEDALCADFMRAIVQDADFIPGFYEGVPIAASYRERWWKILPTRPGFGPVER